LVNTFLLLGAIGLTAWWASGSTTVVWRSQRRLMMWLGVALLGMVFIGTFGTFASLASTIFPSESFLEGVQKDFARDEHWLIRLRIWHPIIATALGVYLVVLRQRLLRVRPSQTVETLSFAILLLYGVQYALGALNAILLSPVWLQLTHLLMTDTLWLLLIFMSAAALSGAPASDAIDRRLAAASAD
jgi:heme A synthase